MRIKYLMTTYVVSACAAVLPAQTFTLVHVFHGADGAQPSSALIQDSNGNLYGTTGFGGSAGLGTLFKIEKKTPNKETVLHSFTGSSDGENSNNVVLGADGNLYGTTDGAGANGVGTAFRTSVTGSNYSIFYQYQGGANAARPGALLATPNAFYGTAGGGAPFFGGMVCSLTSSGETDLYKFAGGADGDSPDSLVRDSAGNFYGTAGGGDITCDAFGGCGVLFKIDTKGVYSVLHVFVGPDGNGPLGLTIDPAGNLYGITETGGANNSGTVFEFTNGGQLTTLYTFTGGADGLDPLGGLIRDPAGNLYGTTSAGGVVNNNCFLGCGVVFSLSPAAAGTWHETVLHSFNGNDGAQPLAPLLLDLSQPALYGTTNVGGDYNCTTIAAGTSCGVVFKITR